MKCAKMGLGEVYGCGLERKVVKERDGSARSCTCTSPGSSGVGLTLKT
ncbi:hypothetical protein ACFLTM_05245 [Candidatus Bipolaricaulota bacterium]